MSPSLVLLFSSLLPLMPTRPNSNKMEALLQCPNLIPTFVPITKHEGEDAQ
jgi:hypothetical protein